MPRSKFGPALKRLLAAGLIVIDDDGVYRVPQLVHDAVTVLEWTPSASQRAAAANGAHPER
jgi:predicted transcriptional regulator